MILGHLNTAVYLGTVVDRILQWMSMVRHKSEIVADWFTQHNNERFFFFCIKVSFTLAQIVHLWDVMEREIRILDVQPTD